MKGFEKSCEKFLISKKTIFKYVKNDKIHHRRAGKDLRNDT